MHNSRFTLSLLLGILFTFASQAQPWQPDLGNGNYRNPIIHADYSDPDVVRVGEDFYMVSSSFNCVPALPVLHSKDLVNWKIVNHVIPRMPPEEVFSIPQNGNGVWAPAIRYHKGTYYVYFGDPDYGIYMSSAKDPEGEWTPLTLVHEAKGWIDPCPLWDDDGKAYLVHAFAGSRSGIKTILAVHEMSPDGTTLIGDHVMIYDGHGVNRVIEGPKFYKKDGYYYIFAPAGGVKPGWQTVLKSKHPLGPYEIRTVMHQGNTDINGPHQGGWVELENGESWFIHFQDVDAYGRIVHMNPLTWQEDGWPIIGIDINGDGIGEPVREHRKPSTGAKDVTPSGPQTSDEFNGSRPGLQWQWNANPEKEWMLHSGNLGFLRMYCVRLPENHINHWLTPHLLLQKFPAHEFTATTKVEFNAREDGDKTGLIIMGMSYAALQMERKDGELFFSQVLYEDAEHGAQEKILERIPAQSASAFLRVTVAEGGICSFSYSHNGNKFEKLGESFTAVPGKWIGARVGLYATSTTKTNDSGSADFDWFRID